jgi:glycerol uptake facilitator protein
LGQIAAYDSYGTSEYGASFNPAGDFGPRLAQALLPIAGKGGSDWSYAWIPVLGPFIGAALAGGLLRMIHA